MDPVWAQSSTFSVRKTFLCCNIWILIECIHTLSLLIFATCPNCKKKTKHYLRLVWTDGWICFTQISRWLCINRYNKKMCLCQYFWVLNTPTQTQYTFYRKWSTVYIIRLTDWFCYLCYCVTSRYLSYVTNAPVSNQNEELFTSTVVGIADLWNVWKA